MLFWLGENRSRATFDAFLTLSNPLMALTFDLDFQIILICHKWYLV